MAEVFPELIRNLPEAEIPLKGSRAYLSQSKNHQIIFWEFSEDVEVPEHCHESHWSVVLEGRIDLVIEGVKQTFSKGESFLVPKNAKHSAKIHAGYADITFFNEKERYKPK